MFSCVSSLYYPEKFVILMKTADENAIWSFLMASGYLKVLEANFTEETGRPYYRLTLTNKEVRLMFENMVRGWFSRRDSDYNDFVKALLLDDLDAMNEYMNRVAENSFSYFDTSARMEPERFYHGFVLGLMVDLNDRYLLTSNRESGFGRYDVMLEPRTDKDDALLLEFKVFQPRREKTLEDTVQTALKQIAEKDYAAALRAKGIPEERIRKYGIVFRGKEVLIGQHA